MKLFLSGGAGYIGSHTCIELLSAGHQIVIFDNLDNSSSAVIEKIERISGRRVSFIKGDIRDSDAVAHALRTHACDAIFHFAGLKSIKDSLIRPLDYYDINVGGTLSLLGAMRTANVKAIIFSSSASIYGEPKYLPITEDHPLLATHPYGRTKIIVEEMLESMHRHSSTYRVGILRYFNPVGAHESGLLGEAPKTDYPNLFDIISRIAIGKSRQFEILGANYNTHDGSPVRDYIHVVDLAQGHVKALNLLRETPYFSVNLGTGKGTSVFDILRAFERASGATIPYSIAPRRDGDVPSCYADVALAERLLNWRASLDVNRMCFDSWRWITQRRSKRSSPPWDRRASKHR